MPKVVQTAQTEQDLVDIWVYTAEEWSFEQADNYLDELANGLNRLVEHPQLGHARDDLRTGYRALPIGQHVAFYKMIEEEIQIVRVLHKSVDAPRHV